MGKCAPFEGVLAAGALLNRSVSVSSRTWGLYERRETRNKGLLQCIERVN
jgi:hypothetical protein